MCGEPARKKMRTERELECGCKNADETSNRVEADADQSSITKSIGNPSVYDWQAGQCCSRQRLQHIFRNGLFTDVVFIVGQEPQTQRIPAHKVLLAAGSRFFETMFFSEDWALKSNEVPLPDDDPVAFEALVRFLYTDDVKLAVDTVVAVLSAANKYNIPPLARECTDFISKNVCPENVSTILSQAVFFHEPTLIETCLGVIDQCTLRAVMEEGFLSIDLNTLCSILKRDTLKISEFALFQAILRWSDAECLRQELELTPENRLSVSKEAVSLIRFPLMSVKEFSSKEVVESGLLSDKEALSIMLYFSRKEKSCTRFSDTPRSYPYLVLNRFPAVHSNARCPNRGSIQLLQFTTDRDIWLKGIGVYGSPQGPGVYKLSLSLVEMQPFSTLDGVTLKDCQIIEEITRLCNYNGEAKIFRVLLDDPVQLIASKIYRLTLTIIMGPDSFIGQDGSRNVSMKLPGPGNQKVQITFCTSDRSIGNSNSLKGQIPELLFEV